MPDHIPGELQGLLKKHGIKEHGFAFPERAICTTLAAEEAGDKTFAPWRRTLKG